MPAESLSVFISLSLSYKATGDKCFTGQPKYTLTLISASTHHLQPPSSPHESQSPSPSRSVLVLLCGGGAERGGSGGLWWSRLGLGPLPPSLSVLEVEGGSGGARRGRGADEGVSAWRGPPPGPAAGPG